MTVVALRMTPIGFRMGICAKNDINRAQDDANRVQDDIDCVGRKVGRSVGYMIANERNMGRDSQ